MYIISTDVGQIAGNILFEIWSSPTRDVPQTYRRSQPNNTNFK